MTFTKEELLASGWINNPKDETMPWIKKLDNIEILDSDIETIPCLCISTWNNTPELVLNIGDLQIYLLPSSMEDLKVLERIMVGVDYI